MLKAQSERYVSAMTVDVWADAGEYMPAARSQHQAAMSNMVI